MLADILFYCASSDGTEAPKIKANTVTGFVRHVNAHQVHDGEAVTRVHPSLLDPIVCAKLEYAASDLIASVARDIDAHDFSAWHGPARYPAHSPYP